MSDIKVELKRRGVCVIIPTYNNVGTVVDVVSRSQEYCSDVFVVLDGCTDSTLSALEAMPCCPETIVLQKNTGKGNALKVGFKHAIEAGFSYAITLDADGQHFPEDIPLFLSASRQYPDSILVGNRAGLDRAERSKASSFANRFSNFWFFVQTLQALKDTQSGFRLYPLKKISGLSVLTSRYEAELELLVFSSWHGTSIKSLDVRVFYPPIGQRVSHFRPLYDFSRISLLNIVLCILSAIYGLPLTIIRFLFREFKTVFLYAFYLSNIVLLITPILFLYLKIGGMTEKKKENFHKFLYNTSKGILAFFGYIGAPYTLHNEFGEDFSRPAIIISNHQSFLDLLPVMAASPKIVIVTADWVWKKPPHGFIVRNADFLSSAMGTEEILSRYDELRRKGYSIMLFPEGTRSLDGNVMRFHQGAFYLAKQLQMDILPVVVYGTGRVLPKHARLVKNWPIHLKINKRVPFIELAQHGTTTKDYASYFRKYYISEYAGFTDSMDHILV